MNIVFVYLTWLCNFIFQLWSMNKNLLPKMFPSTIFISTFILDISFQHQLYLFLWNPPFCSSLLEQVERALQGSRSRPSSCWPHQGVPGRIRHRNLFRFRACPEKCFQTCKNVLQSTQSEQWKISRDNPYLNLTHPGANFQPSFPVAFWKTFSFSKSFLQLFKVWKGSSGGRNKFPGLVKLHLNPVSKRVGGFRESVVSDC